MATTLEIARRAGVSDAAVSWVLNGRWKDRRICRATHDRVWKIAQELNYRPNRLARGLRSRKTNTIGFVIRTMDHPAHGALNERIVLLLESRKFEVLLTLVPDFDETAEAEELYYSHYPEGMILGPTYMQRPTSFFREVARRGTPFVCYDGTLDYPLDQVTHDYWKMIKMSVAHLQELGHRRIDTVSYQEPAAFIRRFRELSGGGQVISSYGTYKNGFEFGMGIRVGANQPTAYMLQDPQFAIGFMRALFQRGIRIPDQIAFVTASCGELGEFLPLSLTTVYPDLKEKADKIVQLLLQRLGGELPPEPRCVVVEPVLTVGETTVSRARAV